MSQIALRDIRICLEGIIPSTMATCSADGTPNVSHVSQVYYVDENHIALSFQFFNTTRRNIQDNPQATIQVYDPRVIQPYLIHARYVRSEFEGPLFDQMSLRLQVVASYEGMTDVFALRAADIYRVTNIEKVEGVTSLEVPASPPELGSFDGPIGMDLEALRVVTERLSRCETLEDALDRSLLLLEQFFGLKHLILMLADEAGRVLTTHATRGYPEGGVGSEVDVGKGLVGMVAKARKPLRLSGVESSLRYARTIRGEALATGRFAVSEEIQLPGLKAPSDQLGIPLIAGQRLCGVLIAETTSATGLGIRDQNILCIVGNQLASTIARLKTSDDDVEPANVAESVALKAKVPSPAGPVRRFRFTRRDDSLFVDDQYLIKNVPARILWYLLKAHRDQGRVEFSNRELRAESWFCLPGLKDNLESRLILLKKRLEEKRAGVLLKSVGRGRIRLELACTIEMVEKD